MAGLTIDAGRGAAPDKKVGRGAVILLLLFALPFAGAGTFVGYLAVSMVNDWRRAQSWDEVPAHIVSADLDVSYDDSTTYRLVAEYRYEYGGRTYASDRVSTSSGSDNIGSFHQDRYAELSPFIGSDRPFRCFVNPDDPSEALLFRQLRPGMLAFLGVFSAAFCLVGYGLMFVAVYGSRLVSEADRLKQARPAEPWLWDTDWVDGRITAGSRGAMIGALVFATLWNLVSAPMLLIVPDELADGNRLALLGLLFPLVGLGLAWWAIHATLQWRKFGNSELEMFANPAVLGGWLEGRIHTNIRERSGGPFLLTLSCMRKETRGSGKNRSTTRRVLWQDTAQVPVTGLLAGPRGLSIPVRFAIPHDAGPQSDPEADDPIEWRLSVAAELPGIDYGTDFHLPVFRTEDSNPEFTAAVAEPERARTAEPPADLDAVGIVRRPTPAGGVQYVFRRSRARGAAIGLTLFTVVWCGFIPLMIGLGAPIFFPVIFALFALLMLAGMVDLWLKQTRVEVAGGRLAFNRRYLGPGRTRLFAAADIESIGVDKGMQANETLYHQVVLRTAGGKKITLATQIRDRRLAQRIVDDLQEALGSRLS